MDSLEAEIIQRIEDEIANGEVSELVTRIRTTVELREVGVSGPNRDDALLIEAADRITHLEAAIRVIQDELSEAQDMLMEFASSYQGLAELDSERGPR